jgi:hypothetical protein
MAIPPRNANVAQRCRKSSRLKSKDKIAHPLHFLILDFITNTARPCILPNEKLHATFGFVTYIIPIPTDKFIVNRLALTHIPLYDMIRKLSQVVGNIIDKDSTMTLYFFVQASF